LAREYSRDHVIGDKPQLDQVVAKPATMLALVVESFTQMLSTDEVLADENFA